MSCFFIFFIPPHYFNSHAFFALAPGLADLVALASSTDLNDDSLSEGDSVSNLSKAGKSTSIKPVKRSTMDVYGEDEDSEDIEMISDDDFEPAIATLNERAPRITKAAASKKISAQLVE